MSDARQCPDCGAALPPDADGLCPKCLLRAGLESDRHLHIRCPHCRQAVEIVDDTSLREITCPSCHSSFSLLGDETVGHEPEVPRRIGQFELVERIGVGAFGTVWKARDGELDRTVAVKIPRKGNLSPAEAEQFLREARAAAQLRHPHIVSVHEVGRDGPTVYIVSDYVQGTNLADWLSARTPTPREAAELCATIAEALQHAHEAGVVHRDLKPSNILLDGDGRPHVTDFGLAKRDGGEITITMDGKVLGTPAYMSPEQARGEGHAADPRSDVYSLGVVLFELLTGEPPFRGTMQMLLHQVIHDEPPQPRKLNAAVPRDLQTICLKCMEKEPRRRYASAAELALDLRRFLAGEPIAARPIGRLTRSIKWARRRPAAATLLGVSVLSALLVTIGAVSLAGVTTRWYREATNRELAEKSLRETEQGRRKDAEQAATEQQRLRKLAVTETNRATAENGLKRRHLYAAHMAQALLAYEKALLPTTAELLERQRPQEGEEDLRTFAWHYLARKCQQQHVEIDAKCGTVMSLAFSPDGKSLFSKGADFFRVRKWDLTTGMQSWLARTGTGSKSHGYTIGETDLIIGDDPRTILSFGEYGAELLDTESGKSLGKPRPCLLPAPDGRTTVARAKDGAWEFRDIRDDTVIRKVKLQGKYFCSFSHDGKRIVGISLDDLNVAQFDAETGKVIKAVDVEDPGFRVDGSPVRPRRALVSPDGQRVLIGTWRIFRYHYSRTLNEGKGVEGNSSGGGLIPFKQCVLVDANTGRLLGRIDGHDREILAVAFSPDGKLLATASEDCTVRLWDAHTGKPLGVPLWHEEGATAVAFSPDGKLLASGGHDGKIKVWALDQPAERTSLGPVAVVLDVAISPNGETIAAAGRLNDRDQRGAVWLLDAASGKLHKTIEQEMTVTSVAFHPRQPLLAWGTWTEKPPQPGGFVTIWDVQKEQMAETIQVPKRSYPVIVRFSPDGKALVAAFPDNFMLWDVAAGKRIWEVSYSQHNEWPAFSPDGRQLAFADWSRCQAHEFSLVDGKRVAELGTRWDKGYGGRGGRIGASFVKGTYSPHGRLFALPARTTEVGGAGKVELIDVASGEAKATLDGRSVDFTCVAFSPDGRTLVTGDRDGTLLFWDPVTGQQRMRLAAHREQVSSVAFTPDGKTLISAGWDGAVCFHRAGEVGR